MNDGLLGGECHQGQQAQEQMLSELRNRHVRKLLNHLGGKDVPPYLQKAIKKSYSEFVEDINNMEDIHNDQDGNTTEP